MKRNKTMILAFTFPGAALFVGTFVYPIIRTVVMSFFKITEITDSISKWQFNGFENYGILFRTSLFQHSLWNILRIWLIGGCTVLSISLLLAAILTSGVRFKGFFSSRDLFAERYQLRCNGDYVDSICIQSIVRIFNVVF